MDSDLCDPVLEMGLSPVVVVAVVSLCAVRVALMKVHGNQSDIHNVHRPSNQVSFWEWTGRVVVGGRMAAVSAYFRRTVV